VRGFTDKLRKRIEAGAIIIFGVVVDSRSGSVIEMYEDTGFDAVLIDREHSALNSETIQDHIRLARALEIPCMVRVADFSYHEMNRTLDQAPDGIFVPRIRTREDVEHIMRTVKYPPLGQRGLGGTACPISKYTGWPSVTQQVDYANRDVVVGIQIETAEALANLDEILSVPGIDMAVVGNNDLSLGMGLLGKTDSDAYIDAIMKIIAACQRHNVAPGIACTDPAKVRFWADRGMRIFWYANDIYLMWQTARTNMQALKKALEK
jgi:2-keto-3-deoxy-L-rhamnonate aldolase RhmA